MDVLFRTHLYRWTCPECGPIEDRSLEVQVEGKGAGRWFEDGHLGQSTLDENKVEFVLAGHLSIDFLVLEQVRMRRARRREADSELGPELDNEDRELLDERLRTEGHTVSRTTDIFEQE